MKKIVLMLLIFSSHAYADLVVVFHPDTVKQQVVNGAFSENAQLNLKVSAALELGDTAGIKALLGYEFFCEGDPDSWKNKAQQVKGSNSLFALQLKYDLAKPNRWDQWDSGTKNCLLTWTGSAIRTRTEAGASFAFSVGGVGPSLTFNYAPAVAQHADEGRSGPNTEPFAMVKPVQAPGSFCEDIN